MGEEQRTPAEREVRRRLEHVEGVGKPLSDTVRQRARSVESYLRGGDPPRWMTRLAEIERGYERARRQLGVAYASLRERCGGDADEFARRWRAHVAAQRFRELNELIATHNEWYPVERDLPIDLRTRDYVLVNGRSYRRPPLDAAWILERFPAA